MNIVINTGNDLYEINDQYGCAKVTHNGKILAYYHESDPAPFIAAVATVLNVWDSEIEKCIGNKVIDQAVKFTHVM